MDKKFCEVYYMQAKDKRRILFGTFITNIVIISVVWLMTFIPGIIKLGSVMTGLSLKMTHVAVIGALGMWGVFSFAFFLAPAIASIRSRSYIE